MFKPALLSVVLAASAAAFPLSALAVPEAQFQPAFATFMQAARWQHIGH
jgi:hypothetical protein